VTVVVAEPLLVGAALFAVGVFAASFRRDRAALLRSLPLLAAGAAVALAGASRLASANADPLAGQELAVLVCLAGLGLGGLAAASGLRGPRS
jgi:NADH:ubiquinone oxidoreductase subunit K